MTITTDTSWVNDFLGQRRYPWSGKALCMGVGTQVDPTTGDVPNPFFPTRVGLRPKAFADSAAKAICRRCPVRLECLRTALDQEEEWGVWGGVGESHRRNWMREGVLTAEEMIELQDRMDAMP